VINAVGRVGVSTIAETGAGMLERATGGGLNRMVDRSNDDGEIEIAELLDLDVVDGAVVVDVDVDVDVVFGSVCCC
jgi:hypothetical protein